MGTMKSDNNVGLNDEDYSLYGENVVERILRYLECEELKDCGKDKDDELEQSLRKIGDEVGSAERWAEEGRSDVRNWLRHLKGVLHQIEDVLDECVVVKRELLNIRNNNSGKARMVLRYVEECCSEGPNAESLIKRLVKEVDNLTRKLHHEVVPQMSNISMTPWSSSEQEEFIGRDQHKSVIIEILVGDSSISSKDIKNQVIWIEGSAGVGKTTLARLIYNDKKVMGHFDVRGWGDMSSINPTMEAISKRIMPSITYRDHHVDDDAIKNLQNAIKGKMFLLVLDNFHGQQEELLKRVKDDLLKKGKVGSKVIVTCKDAFSMESSRYSDIVHECDLEPLSESEAWLLFTKALQREGGASAAQDWENEKPDILAHTMRLPIAIRFMASAIHYLGQNGSDFRLHVLGDQPIRDPELKTEFVTLVSRLRNMSPSLKQCLSFLLLFPKDYEFHKEDVIYMWKALGFLRKSNDSNKDEVGISYWKELMSDLGQEIQLSNNRFLMMESKKDEKGRVRSCKIPYGTYIAARLLWENENSHWVVEASDEKRYELGIPKHDLYHLSFVQVPSSWEPPQWLYELRALRSLLIFPKGSGCVTIHNIHKIFKSLTRLRVLVLGNFGKNNDLHSMGELKHLRYLKIWGNLTMLPDSITRLQYLKILDLSACEMQLRFPKSSPNSHWRKVELLYSKNIVVDEKMGLNEQKAISNIVTENVNMYFKKLRQKDVGEISLRDTSIKNLRLEWSSSYKEAEQGSKKNKEEEVLKLLQPPQGVKDLKLVFWKGVEFPKKVGNNGDWLPKNLVSLHIEGCEKCKRLPMLSQLPYLKYLYLLNMKALEYIEETDATSHSSEDIYFPSLRLVNLEELPYLAEWRSKPGKQDPPPPLNKLSSLRIFHCPMFKSIAKTPNLESLTLQQINIELLKALIHQTPNPSMEELNITSVFYPPQLPIEQPLLRSLTIRRCKGVEELIVNSPLCKKLNLLSCDNLSHVNGTFNELKELKIWNSGMKSVDLRDVKNVKSLTIGGKMEVETLLSNNGHCLLMLEKVSIYQLDKLETLPLQLKSDSKLGELEINRCLNLKEISVYMKPSPSEKEVDEASLKLTIEQCPKLISLRMTCLNMEHVVIQKCDCLTEISGEELNIERLVIRSCENLKLWRHGNNNLSWKALNGLKDLTLDNISKINQLPSGFAEVTTLECLDISNLPHLKSLPDEITQLSQLETLIIRNCPSFTSLPTTIDQLGIVYLEINGCQELATKLKSPTNDQEKTKIKYIPFVYVDGAPLTT